MFRLDDRDLAILHALTSPVRPSIDDLARATQMSQNGIHARLKKLERAGLVAHKPRKARTSHLTAAGRARIGASGE